MRGALLVSDGTGWVWRGGSKVRSLAISSFLSRGAEVFLPVHARESGSLKLHSALVCFLSLLHSIEI